MEDTITNLRFRARARNLMARASRSLPDFRGKATAGAAVGAWLTDAQDDRECILPIRMKRGGRMILDIRSRTERWTYWTGRYDDDVLDRITAMLPAGATVLDVGANIGFYAVALGRHAARTGGTVFAFEPIPANFNRLEENLLLNGLQRHVTAVNLALGDAEETIAFNLELTDGAGTGNGVIMKGNVPKVLTASVECTVKPLDKAAGELGIHSCDFMKVDVEGFEYQFLKGAETFIRRTRPTIYGEFNRYWMQQLGYSILDAAAILQPLGYRPYRAEKASDLQPITDLRPGEEEVWWMPE